MKVVFLDFDGVLNSDRTTEKIYVSKYGFRVTGLDRDKVELVSKLCEETDSDVVISSTWRDHFNLVEIRELFAERGFKGRIVGRTPKAEGYKMSSSNRQKRGEEIQLYIDQCTSRYRPGTFVVLDDIETQFYPDRQVLCRESEGFTQKGYEKAVKILTGQWESDIAENQDRAGARRSR